MSNSGPRALDIESEGLGIENGSFMWNAVEEEKSKDNEPEVKMTSSEVTITETGPESIQESTDHLFELKDITINFPDGKLTCITGPTASGKTALLVCFMSLGVSRWLIIHRSDGAPWRDDHPPRWTDYYV
jgi:ABC-type glutathione transport system ATPase component